MCGGISTKKFRFNAAIEPRERGATVTSDVGREQIGYISGITSAERRPVASFDCGYTRGYDHGYDHGYQCGFDRGVDWSWEAAVKILGMLES